MGKLYYSIVTVSLFLCTELASGQKVTGIEIGSGFSIMPAVNYVSSAAIQLNLNSPDLFERFQTEELSGGYGYGLSVRKKIFSENLSFGLTAEYLKIYDDELTQTFESSTTRVRGRVKEELWIVPLELTGQFNIPQFTEDLNIFLGGGVGMYFGDRKRTVLNFESKTISREPGFSFVILSGMEMILSNKFSGVFEVRFRQGEYKVKSEFPSSVIIINGGEYLIEKNLNSRVFVDGLKISLGLSYNF